MFPLEDLLWKNDQLSSQVEFLRLEGKQFTRLQETGAVPQDGQRYGPVSGRARRSPVPAGGGTQACAFLVTPLRRWRTDEFRALTHARAISVIASAHCTLQEAGTGHGLLSQGTKRPVR